MCTCALVYTLDLFHIVHILPRDLHQKIQELILPMFKCMQERLVHIGLNYDVQFHLYSKFDPSPLKDSGVSFVQAQMCMW